MTKATHKGTCQCCGAIQKITRGKLARHGYTLTFGWQAGTCRGSGRLPFEQSIDLVEDYIKTAEDSAVAYENTACDIEENRGGKLWLQLGSYVGRKWVQSWYSVEFETEVREYDDAVVISRYTNPVTGRSAYYNYSGPREMHEALAHWAAARANAFRRDAARQRQYADWQRDRIRDWKPSDLIPLD